MDTNDVLKHTNLRVKLCLWHTTFSISKEKWVCEKAQQVRSLALKSENAGSTLWTHRMKTELTATDENLTVFISSWVLGITLRSLVLAANAFYPAKPSCWTFWGTGRSEGET